MELISVIVPIYNVERYLRRCVESLRRQTYSHLEIILVDDGSPDGCPDICDEYIQLDNRIKVLHKKNDGLGYARNSGLEITTGQYVLFIDSDDWISDDHIENLYREMILNQAEMVLGSFTDVNKKGEVKRHHMMVREGVYEKNEITEDILPQLIAGGIKDSQDVIIQSSCCMNLYCMHIIRENKLRFGSEKVAVAEDLLFNIDYLRCISRLTVLNEMGYFYYQNEESISRKFDRERFERTIAFYEVITKKITGSPNEEDLLRRKDRCFLLRVRVALKNVTTSSIGKKDKLQAIKQIIETDIVQTVIENYPIKYYPVFSWLLMVAIKTRNPRFVYFLMLLREKARVLC